MTVIATFILTITAAFVILTFVDLLGRGLAALYHCARFEVPRRAKRKAQITARMDAYLARRQTEADRYNTMTVAERAADFNQDGPYAVAG